MSIAGTGLLANPPGDVGVSFVGNLSAITRYTNLTIITEVVSVVNAAVDEVAANNFSSATLASLVALGANNFPAITDTVSAGNIIGNLVVVGTSANAVANLYLVSSVITYDLNQIMGNGDLSKFCQTFQTAQGYVGQANTLLNSVKNADIIAATFDPATGGMNTLSTGGLNQVTTNISALGRDFYKLGQLIYFGNLDNLGLPGELLAQIGRITNGGIPTLSAQLESAGLTARQLTELGRGTNTLDAQGEKIAYQAMTTVTGQLLTQVLTILGVTVTNITAMSQLLNPKLILPNSYKTLVCPTSTALVPVYLANDAVNTALDPVLSDAGVSAYTGPNNTNSLATLKLIIPPDQAVANKALSRSLQQIKNITNSTLPALSTAMSTVRSIGNLSAIANLTTPVPSSVTSFYKSQLGVGTGVNGTIRVVDVIGVASGFVVNDALNVVSNSISNLQVSNATGTLSACYRNMLGTLGNVFGGPVGNVVIPSGPGAGSYESWDEAFTNGLIPAANTAIANIVTYNSSEVLRANSAWGNIILTLGIQQDNQDSADMDFGNLQPDSMSAAMSFASSLHEYGLDVVPGGASEYLTSLANPATLGGQSVIASLQEGRNISSLEQAGISLDTQLSSLPSAGVPTPLPVYVPWSENSANWSKSDTLVAADRNWGLFRSYLGAQIPGWGYGGTVDQSGTVSVKASGSGVDVVIVDAVIDPLHPEFAVNVNGTGGTRVKYVNWYGLNVPGNPAAGQTYNPPIVTNRANSADDSRHACHVAGIAAGNTQGWAPNAAIYNISPQYVTDGVQYNYLYKYILAWHQAKRAAGNMRPTICNNSWYSRYTIPYGSITSVTWRGTTVAGPFSTAQLLGYGIIVSGGIVTAAYQSSVMDTDVQNCINAGIIMVACAGNDDTRISVPGDIDYSNTLTATGFNFGNPIYYARSSSPVTSNVISVGAIRASVNSPGGPDAKSNFSNCGPRVNLFAPGSFVTSAWLTANGAVSQPTPVPDPRNTAYYIGKDSGTSMASPQVTGILACALEINPNYNQTGALNYIVSNSAQGQIPDSAGGYADVYSLQGSPNNYLTLPVALRN